MFPQISQIAQMFMLKKSALSAQSARVRIRGICEICGNKMFPQMSQIAQMFMFKKSALSAQSGRVKICEI
ncbi:hypothetical protein [Chryseobacterium contaminans]|uniref:hypothetical protein n=1 Tax=Chryseobacterium contaminans TaxID=1423959 RepID=UPI00301691FF